VHLGGDSVELGHFGGVAGHGRAELADGADELPQARRLLLGALGQRRAAAGQLLAGVGHTHGAAADLGHHRAQAFGHALDDLADVRHLVAALDVELVRKVTIGHRRHALAQARHGAQEADVERGGEVGQQQHASERQCALQAQHQRLLVGPCQQRRGQIALHLVAVGRHSADGLRALVEEGLRIAVQHLGGEELRGMLGKGAAQCGGLHVRLGPGLAGALQRTRAPLHIGELAAQLVDAAEHARALGGVGVSAGQQAGAFAEHQAQRLGPGQQPLDGHVHQEVAVRLGSSSKPDLSAAASTSSRSASACCVCWAKAVLRDGSWRP
jgi:hypothetical protein